jgi:release factor glutamine methyltransferase
MPNAMFASEDFLTGVQARQRAYLTHLANQADDVQFDTLGGPVVVPPAVAHPKLDSHLLTLAALPRAKGRVLDAFCGCGVVGLALRNRCRHCLFLDVSEAAIAASKLNAERLGMKNAEFLRGTIESLTSNAPFDLITANPPYMDVASTAPLDNICFDHGHAAVRQFMARSRRLLGAQGSLLITWANFADFAVLEHILIENRFSYAVGAFVDEPARIHKNPIEYRAYRCWNA